MDGNVNKLYEERHKRIMQTIKREKSDRVPIDGQFREYWSLDFAGYDIKEGLADPVKLYSAMEKVAEYFQPDFCPFAFPRSPLFYRGLGAKTFVPSEDGILQHPEVSGMKVEEYPEFIENPIKVIIEKIIPRLYTELDKPKPYNMISLARGMQLQNDAIAPLVTEAQKLSQKMGMPIFPGAMIEAPMDYLADFIRGFTQITFDMRRNPEFVIEASEAILPLMLRLAMTFPPSIQSWIAIPLHMPIFMREKDFERFYWPTFKKMLEILVSKGYWIQIFLEGDWTRYLDHLQDLPNHGLIGFVEYIDFKKCKEKLGNTMAIKGGYPTSLLQYGSKQECIDKAKEILDIMAPGGGYILGMDKGINYATDGKPENIKALFDFVKEYGKY